MADPRVPVNRPRPADPRGRDYGGRVSSAHVVVVGAGLAGARSVAELRSQGFDGQVTLLGAEGVAPYDHPPLSKHLFDRTEPAWLTQEIDVDAEALADDVRLASPATRLTVTPEDVRVIAGEEIVADAAILATGARAVVPGALRAGRTLRTAADAAGLRQVLVPGSRLVIVGAGWIGAELAWSASRAGVRVTVLEGGIAPMAGALGPGVGALTIPWFTDAGIDLRTLATVEDVTADSVTLAGGEVLPADVVLVAVGARADSAWLADTLRLAPDGAVPVDGEFRPETPGMGRVRVVGDLARRRSVRHGWVPGGHWDVALHGPTVAVASLLAELTGEPAPVPGDPAPYVFSDQFGKDLGMYGRPDRDDEVVLRGDPKSPAWSVLWFTPGTDELTGVFAVDRPKDVTAARHLFTGVGLPRVDRARAANPDVPLRETAR